MSTSAATVAARSRDAGLACLATGTLKDYLAHASNVRVVCGDSAAVGGEVAVMASAEGMDQPQTLDARSSTCVVCLGSINDPRLLDCLHSFCRGCINRLALTSSSAEKDGDRCKRTVRCPVCRSTCQIPENGADGLLKDATRPVGGEELKCHACKDDGEGEAPSLWCEQCRLAFCKEHAIAHVMAASGHGVTAVSERSSQATPVPAMLCSDHHQPMDFHCVSCGEAVCGHCTAVGKHAGHQPVVALRDVIAERKTKVFTEVEQLERELLPPLDAALESVNRTSIDLASRADQVRDKIRIAGQRLVDVVNTCVAGRLQEVEDLEQSRAKLLDKQHDALKELRASVTSVVGFAESLKTGKVSQADMSTLLPVVEERVASLRACDVDFVPKENSALGFLPPDEETVVTAIGSLLGKMAKCRAAAKYSVLVKTHDDEEAAIVPGKVFTITVQAKDKNGESLTEGGDIITTRWVKSPRSTPVQVKDLDNGRYSLSFTPQDVGAYVLEVLINGDRFPFTISMLCQRPPMIRFDREACQKGIAINDDCCRATVTQASDKNNYPLVLGRPGMTTGQHQWKVHNVIKNPVFTRWVGVSPRIAATDIQENKEAHQQAYFWNGYDGNTRVAGQLREGVGGRWQDNDVIQVVLDCDSHTLRMTNQRSGQSITFPDLPDVELFPCFCFYAGENNIGSGVILLPNSEKC